MASEWPISGFGWYIFVVSKDISDVEMSDSSV